MSDPVLIDRLQFTLTITFHYPNLLPAREGNPNSLTIDNAAAGPHALKSALIWWPLGMVLAGVYFVYAYRMFFRGGPKPQLGTE